MGQTKRKTELSLLNVLFCLMVIWIHCASSAVIELNHASWQFGLVICSQRIFFVSVTGFFFLSGLKLTLPRRTASSAPRYWLGRVKTIFLPYLLAVSVYYIYFWRHGYFPFSLSDFAGYAVRGDLSAPFYFVIALAQFVLLAPLFRIIAEKWSPILTIPLALGITWLSAMYFNDLLHLLSPAWNFGYSDRIFTTYVVYYLAGCYAGRSYEDFLGLLRQNRALLWGTALVFAALDVICSWRQFVQGIPDPFLEILHILYQVFAIPALFSLAAVPAVQRGTLPPLVQRMDRASFLVYLYHALIIVCFNNFLARVGISRISIQFILRLLVVYPAAFALSMLWQWAFAKGRAAISPAPPPHKNEK